MRKPITIFRVATGEIRTTQRIDFGVEPIVLGEGLDWIEGYADASAMVVDLATRQAVPKPVMSIEVAGNVLTGIPDDATLIYGNDKFPDPITDGEFEIDVDYEQTVRVAVRHPLYQTWEADVACTPEA